MPTAREKQRQPEHPRLELRMPPDPARLLRVRERIRDYLRHHLVDRTQVDEIVLAVEEAATNAIRHSGVSEDVEIGLRFDEDSLVAVVHDHGPGFDVEAFDPTCVPDPLRTGGRGLFLICCLTDEVQLDRSEGLLVRMTKHVNVSTSTPSSGDAATMEEERTRLLLEDVPEGFVAIDWDYRIAYANAEARRLLQAEDIEGRVLWDAFPTILGTPIEAALRAAMEEGRGDRFEYAYEPDDIWFEIRVHPTSGGISAYFVDISERKRGEREREARMRQQELLARIVDALPIPVAYVDADLIVKTVNQTGTRLAARPVHELLDRPAANLFGRNQEPLAALEQVARTREPLERVMQWILPQPLRRVEYLTILLPDVDDEGGLRGIFLQGMDATELISAQRSLAESHDRLEAIAAGMTQGIMMLDREHRFLFANRAALDLVGQPLSEMIGRRIEDVLPTLVGMPLYKCMMEVLHDRKPQTMLAGPSPTGRWYDARCYPTPEGVTLLFQDVTEERAVNEQLRSREEASRRAQARADVLADVTAAAATGQTVEEVAEAALRGLALHLGLVGGGIHAVDERAGRLRALALFGYDDRIASELQDMPIDDSTTIGRLVRLGLPYLTHETAELSEATRDRAERAGISGNRWIVLPIGHERIVAVLSLVFNDPRSFTGADIAFDRAIADQLALAMERADFQTERSRELARLEAVMEASSVSLVYLDADLRIMLVNSAQERVAGRSRDELLGKRFVDVSGDSLLPALKEVLETGERRAVTELPWRYADQPERGLTYWDMVLTPVLNADGHVEGIVQSAQEVTARVRDARMRTALQEAAQALTETLEEEQVFVRLLGESAIALEAESAVLCLLEGDHLVMRYVYGLSVAVVGLRVDPREAPAIWQALRAEGPIAAEHSDWDMPAFSGGRVLRARSLLAMPLRIMGVPSGVMVFSYHSEPRRFGELEFDFASRIGTLAAQIVQNSRLYASMRRARGFSEALNEINALVESTLDVRTVAGRLLERAAASVGADGMRLMTLGFGRWKSVHGYSVTEAPFLVRGAARIAETARVRGRTVVLVRRHADRRSKKQMDRSGVGVIAALPLLQQGKVTGVLLVGRASETPFSSEEVGFLMNVGAILSTALQNTRLFEQERYIARTLQESFLRPVPDLPGISFAARTETAYRPDLVGGDFSDAFDLPGDRVGVLIGDVQGKGIQAAGLTETVRSSLRALLRAGFSPAEALRHANDVLLDQNVDQFVTVFLLIHDQRTGTAVCSGAGHPFPLLVRQGSVAQLHAPPGAPLGTFPWTYEEERHGLLEGDTLVLYTDGLSEARKGTRFFGEEGARAVLEGLGEADPQTVVDALMRAVVGYADQLRDDLHVLVLKLEPGEEGP